MKCITLSVRAQGAPFDRLYFYGADRPIRVSYCILGSVNRPGFRGGLLA